MPRYPDEARGADWLEERLVESGTAPVAGTVRADRDNAAVLWGLIAQIEKDGSVRELGNSRLAWVGHLVVADEDQVTVGPRAPAVLAGNGSHSRGGGGAGGGRQGASRSEPVGRGAA